MNGSDVEAREGPQNIVVVLQGTATGEVRNVGGVDQTCFDVDLIDPSSGRVISAGIDCLNLASIAPIGDDGGFGIDNTTFFDLPGGNIVSLSRTTIQPVETAVPGATHITGEVDNADNIISDMSTGRFAGATGSTSLNGTVDMSLFGSGIISFKCIFVINLD